MTLAKQVEELQKDKHPEDPNSFHAKWKLVKELQGGKPTKKPTAPRVLDLKMPTGPVRVRWRTPM